MIAVATMIAVTTRGIITAGRTVSSKVNTAGDSGPPLRLSRRCKERLLK
jgi:hypothetical protein